MAISQSEWDKFYGDRINYIQYHRSDFKSITKYLSNDRGHLRPLIWYKRAKSGLQKYKQ